ncbi:PP0621 family protein [Nitrosomonas sp. HPC101]|uniref:PP0621 family protein n=1 Tax=Nitrosomonas sp. HPC101 TaxID=1658667 RepID=UPI0023DBB90B|nr:PP0621 family protein [Nitrosomonas sp. HPC101]
MIFKWVILIVLGFFVFWLLKPFRQKQKHSADTTSGVAEDMVRCAYCDVHLPESESIVGNGHNFCCVEHRQLYLQSRSRRR